MSHLDSIGYKVSYKVLNSKFFGVPQERKRIYIVGTFWEKVSLEDFQKTERVLADILEKNKPTEQSPFVKKLLSKYDIKDLYGKSIKDKRGGSSNIHSWDLETKGKTSKEERMLLNLILKERRNGRKYIRLIGWTECR